MSVLFIALLLFVGYVLISSQIEHNKKRKKAIENKELVFYDGGQCYYTANDEPCTVSDGVIWFKKKAYGRIDASEYFEAKQLSEIRKKVESKNEIIDKPRFWHTEITTTDYFFQGIIESQSGYIMNNGNYDRVTRVFYKMFGSELTKLASSLSYVPDNLFFMTDGINLKSPYLWFDLARNKYCTVIFTSYRVFEYLNGTRKEESCDPYRATYIMIRDYVKRTNMNLKYNKLYVAYFNDDYVIDEYSMSYIVPVADDLLLAESLEVSKLYNVCDEESLCEIDKRIKNGEDIKKVVKEIHVSGLIIEDWVLPIIHKGERYEKWCGWKLKRKLNVEEQKHRIEMLIREEENAAKGRIRVAKERRYKI